MSRKMAVCRMCYIRTALAFITARQDLFAISLSLSRKHHQSYLASASASCLAAVPIA